jgi:hypothetical protein
MKFLLLQSKESPTATEWVSDPRPVHAGFVVVEVAM